MFLLYKYYWNISYNIDGFTVKEIYQMHIFVDVSLRQRNILLNTEAECEVTVLGREVSAGVLRWGANLWRERGGSSWGGNPWVVKGEGGWLAGRRQRNIYRR